MEIQLLTAIVSILWIGIGYISTMLIDKAWGYINKEITSKATQVFVRSLSVIFWPFFLLIYIFIGRLKD